MWVPVNSANRSGSCSENCGFRIAQVVGCQSENGLSYSKNGISNCDLLLEYAGTLRELREWPFHSESVFPEICQDPRKGGFSKGVSVESSVTSEETKSTQGCWPQQYIWHSERHSQERRTFCGSPLLKTPFSWSPENWVVPRLLK